MAKKNVMQMYDIENCTINGKHSYFLEYYNKAVNKTEYSVIIGQELLQCLKTVFVI